MGNLTHVFWGGDSEEKLFGEAQSRKYAPNAWFGELLVWLGVIWGRSGVILECRIPVCNYSVEPSIQITTENLFCLCLLGCYPEIDISVSKLLGKYDISQQH